MDQQRLSGHANGGPTTHLSLVYRWANGGSTEAYRWLATVGPTVGQQRPTGGYSHRWANRGSLDKPTVGHRWLPPLAQQRTYRWCTVGPPLGQRWLATGGPTEARWTNPQWATGGCHRWPISTRTVGPPLAHQSNAIWVPGKIRENYEKNPSWEKSGNLNTGIAFARGKSMHLKFPETINF